MNESKKRFGFKGLSESEQDALNNLEFNSGGIIKGDVSTEQIKESYALGQVTRLQAFKAIVALFRADSRKPIATGEEDDESES